MAFVQAIVQAYAARGMDAAQVLALAQIPPEQVGNSAGRITAQQMEVLSAAAMRELDDEALAGSPAACPGAATACWRAPR